MTDKRIVEILKDMTIIVDTRENVNGHIINYFKQFDVKYIERALKFGDYSFECPTIPELGMMGPFSFESRIAIERKADLDELSGNLAQNRERFENEFQRAKDAKAKLILMVEDGSYQRILDHRYSTSLNEKSYIASLFTFQARYGIEVQFMPAKMSGWFIYHTFRYFLREELKELSTP